MVEDDLEETRKYPNRLETAIALASKVLSDALASKTWVEYDEPTFCNLPLTSTGQLRCHRKRGHEGECWASR